MEGHRRSVLQKLAISDSLVSPRTSARYTIDLVRHLPLCGHDCLTRQLQSVESLVGPLVTSGLSQPVSEFTISVLCFYYSCRTRHGTTTDLHGRPVEKCM